MSSRSDVLRVGVGGPVGSGKTALVDSLCKRMRDAFNIAVVTNDIYTKEDQEFLIRSQALAPERIRGVETGGCPHTAIREDASMNLAAIDALMHDFAGLDLIIVESGGDNLAATFSPELSDLTLYVIDVAAGDKIPRKGGPGIMKSDLLIINKIDLAPHVGASLEVMDRDAKKMRGDRPFVFTNLKTGHGLDQWATSPIEMHKVPARRQADGLRMCCADVMAGVKEVVGFILLDHRSGPNAATVKRPDGPRLKRRSKLLPAQKIGGRHMLPGRAHALGIIDRPARRGQVEEVRFAAAEIWDRVSGCCRARRSSISDHRRSSVGGKSGSRRISARAPS